MAAVYATEVDRPWLPVVGQPEQMLGRIDDIARDTEDPAVDVRAAPGQAAERRVGTDEPVRRLVQGAITAECDDDVIALSGRVAADLSRD